MVDVNVDNLRQSDLAKLPLYAGESFKVIHSFDDSRVKRNNLLRLTLVEVGEVDGGRTRSPGGAESRQERTLKGIPVVAVDAAAFQGIKPPESVAAEGIEDEGHRLISRPGRGRTGTRNPFNPLFGGELILGVACVEREFGQVGLAEVVDVHVDHDDD